MYLESRDLNFLPEAKVKQLAEKIARGLKYLHGRRIIHRDIKLENILLKDVGVDLNPIIADFGYSRQLKEDETCSKLCGSRKYIAPEIFE